MSTILKKIEITNYRSCMQTTFEPNTGLSALIGPNSSGKTTILNAIQLLTLLATMSPTTFRRNLRQDDFSTDCILKAKFEWNGKIVAYEAQIVLVNNERNEDEIIRSNENWSLYQITGSRKKLHIPLSILIERYRYPQHFESGLIDYIVNRYGSDEHTKRIYSALIDISRLAKSITYYSASIFTNPSNCPISFEVESESGSRRGISITGHKKFLYDLYESYKKDTEEYQEFIDVVGFDGLKLIDNLSFKEIETSSSTYKVTAGGHITTKEKKNNLIIPNFIIANNSLSPSQLSEGTFRTLALIFYLITDHSQIMLIEEPEVCVHHGLLSSIIQLIKIYAETKQIIISTHSDQLLDQLDIESVFKVERSEEGTLTKNIKKNLNPEELRALKDYLRNEGGLGEYWKHGAL